MDIKNIFAKTDTPVKGLLTIEKIMLVYVAFTVVVGLFLIGRIEVTPFENRTYIVLGTAVLVGLYRKFPCKALYLLRTYYQVALLGYWYPDIYHFVRFMPNTDHIFASVDQFLFGCQPSIMLSQWLDGFWWRELFNMGYFSYYLMIVALMLFATIRCSKKLDFTASMIVCSFMLYYVIFLFLQSSGPQFYFQHIGIDKALSGQFPDVGNWFCYHSELVHHETTQAGFFTHMVELMQKSEEPIAAFPSSHVGLSTIMMVLAWKLSRKLCCAMLPFYCFLCGATVYIGAHYAIDVLGGFVSAVIIYLIAEKIVNKWLPKELAQ